jgi:C1A family cysteine protease
MFKNKHGIRLYSLLKPPRKNFTYTQTTTALLPESIDWASTGAVTPVKDQGQMCAASWAFASIGALEAQQFIRTNQSITLSEQNLIDCTTSSFYDNNGCSGGLMNPAFHYIMVSLKYTHSADD